jgi:hypothetical protein
MVILLGKEAWFTVDAPLHEVLGHSGKFDTWAAWHWAISKCQLMLTPLVPAKAGNIGS